MALVKYSKEVRPMVGDHIARIIPGTSRFLEMYEVLEVMEKGDMLRVDVLYRTASGEWKRSYTTSFVGVNELTIRLVSRAPGYEGVK